VSDSGLLKWIHDPEVIRRLAKTYHQISAIVLLERQAIEFRYSPREPIAAWGEFVRERVELLKRQDLICAEAIVDGLGTIDLLLEDALM
jgi:hypothetical protein